jgi:pimeloyl-ACP methyl ester carboxylesterase
MWTSSRLFSRQLNGALPSIRAIALDFSSHGRSAPSFERHSIVSYAEDLAALIEVLSLNDVVLVGWSMGAMVAWEYLRCFGRAKVAGLVVIGETAAEFSWPDWPYGIADLAELASLNESVQRSHDELITESVRLLFRHAPRPEDAAWIADDMRTPAPAVASTILLSQTVADFRAFCETITVPTWICHGTHDAVVPIQAGYDLASRLPNARFTPYEASGHCPFWEESSRFNAELSAFVEQCGSVGVLGE